MEAESKGGRGAHAWWRVQVRAPLAGACVNQRASGVDSRAPPELSTPGDASGAHALWLRRDTAATHRPCDAIRAACAPSPP